MDLFDKYIVNTADLLGGYPSERFAFSKNKIWETSAHAEFMTQKESQAELGGGNTPSLGFTVPSSDIDFENETWLIGRDLKKLSGNVPFIKIVFVKTKNVARDDQSRYDAYKQLEFVKYNVNVKGFMERASSVNMREEVRVSKKAVKNGLSFEVIGNTFIDAYLKYDTVEKVRVVFITGDFRDFDKLHEIAGKIKAAQNALNHIFDNIVVDCKSCNLKPVCDEVEGMRELHVGMAKK